MKKNLKKLIPIIAMTTLMTTSMFNSTLVKAQGNVVLQKANIEENKIYINGKILENETILKQNGKNLIPVRAIFEEMGYKIQYDSKNKVITMTKEAQYITFSTTKDEYTFSKMAPQPLGQIPVVKDGNTYVTMEILNLIGIQNNLTSNNILYIGENKQQVKIQPNAIIKSFDEKNQTVLVKDEKIGEVALNLHKDLIVQDENGTKIKTNDWLKQGQKINVEYSSIMSNCLPPLNNPIKITVFSNNENEKPYIFGVTKKLDDNKIQIKDEIVNITKDTLIIDAVKGEAISYEQVMEMQSAYLYQNKENSDSKFNILVANIPQDYKALLVVTIDKATELENGVIEISVKENDNIYKVTKDTLLTYIFGYNEVGIQSIPTIKDLQEGKKLLVYTDKDNNLSKCFVTTYQETYK